MAMIAALLLGIMLGSAGLFAKHINSAIGFGIANRFLHAYFTLLGAVSNQILPILGIIAGFIFAGVGTGVLVAICLVVGAVLGGFVLGKMNQSHLFKSFSVYLHAVQFRLIGVPLALFLYFCYWLIISPLAPSFITIIPVPRFILSGTPTNRTWQAFFIG
jgi:hypothetical protein